MFAHCKSPVWKVDDFSPCYQLEYEQISPSSYFEAFLTLFSYLETLFPLTICVASLLYLCVQIAVVLRLSSYYGERKALNNFHHHFDVAVPSDRDSRSPWMDEHEAAQEEDEEDRDEYLALHTVATHESVIAVNKPRGEVWLVLIEEAAVLGEVGIHLAILMTRSWGTRGNVAAIAELSTWTYVAVLASIRLLLSSSSKYSFSRLWYHTAFIYCFMWTFNVLMFRSAIIHPRSQLVQNFTIADFAISSLLVIIALTSRKGNRAVKLEYEGDLEPSHEQTASVLSLATFSWVDAIVWKGYRKTLELGDVWNLPPRDKATSLLADYRQAKKTSTLAFHLLKYFKRNLLIQAAWAAFSGFLTFAPTLLLKAILEYVENPISTPRNAAWFYVMLLFVSGCAAALADGQALWIGRKICIRLRAIIIGEIYRKALRRKASATANKVLGENKPSQNARPGFLRRLTAIGKKQQQQLQQPTTEPKPETQVGSGTVINLMAVDSFKVAEICAYLHFLWANTPVQVVVAIILLYQTMGYSSIIGIGMMIFLLPINMYIAKQFSKTQKLILAATDARIHTTNEVLSNIRIIKFFAWEQRFMALVEEKRASELRHLRRRYTVWAIAATLWAGTPVLITFLSFLFYTKVERKDLIPSIAFTALSLFQILRIPLDQVADMVAHVQESKVSVDRVEEFLNEPETDKYQQLKHQEVDEDDNPRVGFENATFSWGAKGNPNDEAFKLMNLNINFKVGQLNVISGPTGSGKTSILMALLGEMSLLHGYVYLPGGKSYEDLKPNPETCLTESVAYCAQQAWLANATIKENILFANPFDARRYKEVIVACSLQRDLEILDNGDQTLVGEKGVTLSGGQKQRVSLARALYSRARYVLLDDVLSAVDSHTARWIFDQALLGPLMYNRTCILVTHNISLCLPHSEYAVVLDNGRVAAQGSPDEVIDSGKLSEDISKSRPQSRGPSRVTSTMHFDVDGEDAIAEMHFKQANGYAHGDISNVNGTKSTSNTGYTETKAEGGVKLIIILLYLKAMGNWWYWILAALMFGAQQISSVATNVWIRQWANAYAEKSISILGNHRIPPLTHVSGISGLGTCLTSGTCNWGLPVLSHPTQIWSNANVNVFSNEDVNSSYYLSVYAVLGLTFMLITLLREGILFTGSLTASKRIHSQLMERVARAKFRFFDSTPLGQIMNRFSKDIESVDQEIAPVAVGVVHCLASILTIVVLISVITPGFLIPGIFISILYFLIGKFYINSSRDLKRLESVQRSPLYQQFGETLSGMTTIRAYGHERRFILENMSRVNTHNRPFIFLWAANRWLAFRVDVVGAMVSFFAGVFVVLSVGHIDAGAAGLAMTYAVTFTENVLWFVRLYASNEQNMNSIERIKEYLDVEQEAPPITEIKPPGSWPSRGAVEFVNYSTRYRKEFDLVLKKITFKVLPGEKVGVVGRTGAGKSSLALALFRALEAENGMIVVDDVDIGLIGLQDLRESIVMVPQGKVMGFFLSTKRVC